MNDLSDEEQVDNFVSAAHYDLLADKIIQLVSKPELTVGSNQLAEASTFVDYNAIDMIEREENDMDYGMND